MKPSGMRACTPKAARIKAATSPRPRCDAICIAPRVQILHAPAVDVRRMACWFVPSPAGRSRRSGILPGVTRPFCAMSKILPLSGKGASPTEAAPLNSIAEILGELRAGRMVVIVDDEDRENEGDLIMAAELATPESVALMIRHTSGIVCVAMEEEIGRASCR